MSFQWIGFALVKLPDGAAVESVLFDLKVGAKKQLRWELFHRKSYGLGGRLESLVTNRTSAEAPAPGWKELCLGIVIDCSPSRIRPDEANCGAPLPQDATAANYHLFDLF
jgi:hypothetical protein